MKCTILLLVVIFVFAAAQDPVDPPPYTDDPSTEGIIDNLKNFGKKTLEGLKAISSVVGKDLLGLAAQLLTDGLRLQPNPDVKAALNNSASSEGIFQNIGNLIEQRAKDELVSRYPSQEGILSELGPYYTIPFVEEELRFRYNSSGQSEGPSHEGILGNLGGLALKGLGSIIGGTVGNVISGAGDVLGSLFFALPQKPGVSQEGIISQLGQAGILTSSGELIVRGAANAARSLLRGVSRPYSDLLRSNLFLARGQFSRYPTIEAPGQEALTYALNRIRYHNFSDVKACDNAAEQSLNQLFNLYVENGYGCANNSYAQGQPIIHEAFDIILDAVKRVEDTHREASNCFRKLNPANRHKCLAQDILAIINVHSKKFTEYGEHLAEFVRDFSDLNTQFDVCLSRHLGVVRRDSYRIVSDFHRCLQQHETANLSQPPVQSHK